MKSLGLPDLQYLEASVLCRLGSGAVFPAYKGSMLRGCLGANLRRGLCMARKNDCRGCMLAQNCVFPRIFNPIPLSGASGPAPFCIEPGPGDKRQYSAGEVFDFKLKLFSYGVDYLPFFIQAIRMAGEKGMGNPARPGKFVIERVSCQGQSIYDAANDDLKIPQSMSLADHDAGKDPAGKNGLVLRLLTPLRHKTGNHFSNSLEFRDLFCLILRRVKALCLLGGSRWSLDPERFSALWSAAGNIRASGNDLRWQDWARYSSRQQSSMKFGGIMGKIVYTGDFANFGGLLELARIAHIGKQTSFGLGQLDMEYF